jgi:hypothetical protein
MELITKQFRAALTKALAAAEKEGFSAVEVRAGNLHKKLGSYPGTDHRMPVCCEVMRQAMKPTDKVVDSPAGGHGAGLTIRYRLPRQP